VGFEVAVAVTVMCGCVFQMFKPGLCGDTTYCSTKVFVSFGSKNLGNITKRIMFEIEHQLGKYSFTSTLWKQYVSR
jgi:hypothetical protein